MDIGCCYSLLGVSPESSEKQLRTAYKNLAMILHPDKQPLIPTTNQVQEAYQKIIQDRKRLSRISLTHQIFKESLSNLFQESEGEEVEDDFLFHEQKKRMNQKLFSIKSTLDRWNNKLHHENEKVEASRFECETQRSTVVGQNVTISRLRFESVSVDAEEISKRIRNKINIFSVVRNGNG